MDLVDSKSGFDTAQAPGKVREQVRPAPATRCWQ